MARDPKAEVEISAHSRNLGAKLREARSKFATFGSELKKGVFGKDLVEKGFWGKGGAQLVGNLGSSAVGAVGGFLEDQAKAVYEYQDALVRLKIAGNATGEEIKNLDDKIRHASNETGIGKQAIVGAARQYVALTGDISGASDSIEAWTKVAQASDTAIADVASTAQAMRDNLKIKPGDMEAAFDVLIGQGKSGAIEMKDLASQLAIVSPLMAQFGGGTGVKGLRDLGATVQVVRKGFGGAEETITGVQSLMTAIIKNAKRFQSAGVNVFNIDPKTGTKTLKSFREIIDAVGNSRLMKDPTKLEKAFGRVEAYRAFLQLKDNKAELDQLADSTEYVGTTQRDLSTYSQSTAGKVAIAWTNAKNAIAEVFTPERIAAFSQALVKAVELFAKIVGYIDKTAKFVEDVIEKASPDAKKGGDKVADKIIAGMERDDAAEAAKRAADPNLARGDAALGGSAKRRAQAAALAKENYREYAQLYAQQDSGGLDVDGQKKMQIAQRMALYYQSKADPWGGGNESGGFSAKEFGKNFDPNVMKKTSKEEYASMDFANSMRSAMKGVAQDFAQELAKAIEKRPAQIDMDGSKVSHAVRNAGGIQAPGRTRPGG